MALTAITIKNLKFGAGSNRIADSGGLSIEVTATGNKVWRYRYRLHGKQQMIGLGKWPEVTLEQARKKRDEAKGQLAEGKNPSLERKAEKLRRISEGENTFERVARAFIAVKAKGLDPHYAEQTITRMEQFIFPKLGALPITEIKTPDVVRVIEKIGETGKVETAHKIKRLISQTFRYAVRRGICQYNPAADLWGILPPSDETHHPCIPPAELPELLRKMTAYKGDPLTIAAMHLLALTFVRTGELIGARWAEIDLNRAEWHIPKERMKMKRPHIVPLSKQAISILKGLQPLTGDKEHVFHSQRGKSKHISNGAVLMALRRMGYQGRMTGHGFRTMASTILNERDYKPDWIERQLAHEDGDKVRSAYNRAEYLLERKKMMQDYADMLDGFAHSSPCKVTSIGKRHG